MVTALSLALFNWS